MTTEVWLTDVFCHWRTYASVLLPCRAMKTLRRFFPKEKIFCWCCTQWKKFQKWSDVFFLTNLSHAIWRNAFRNSTPLLFEQCSGGRFKEFFWGILRPWEGDYILLFLFVGLKPTRSSSWLLQRCEMMRWLIHEAEIELNTTRLLEAMIHCSKGSMLRSSICQQTNINKSIRLCAKKQSTVFDAFWDLYPLHPWFQSPPGWHHILRGRQQFPT